MPESKNRIKENERFQVLSLGSVLFFPGTIFRCAGSLRSGNALRFFRYDLSIRHILTLVCQSGQQEALHESFCRIMTPPEREMDTRSSRREKSCAHGLYGLPDKWIKRSFRETPEERIGLLRRIVNGAEYAD